MALSFDEFRKRLLDTAQKNDEERAAITARVSETASQYEPVRPAQAKEPTPAMENRYQNQQMNPISFSQPKFPSRNRRGTQGTTDGETLLGKATGHEKKWQPTPTFGNNWMIRPDYAAQGDSPAPNIVSNIAMSDTVDRLNSRMTLQQDTTEETEARTAERLAAEQREAEIQQEQNALWQQMEGYRNNGQAQKLQAAEQQWAALNQELQELNQTLGSSAKEEAAAWEYQQYNEIVANGGKVLLKQLENLADLAEARYADTRDDRRDQNSASSQYNRSYEALKQQYGDQVDSWLDYVQRMKNQESMSDRLGKSAEFAKEHKFWSSVGSVPLNLASGTGFLDAAGQKWSRNLSGSDTPIDYNSPGQSSSKMVNTIRGTVSEGMNPVGSFLYNTGMSMADSLAAIGVSGATGLGNLGTVLLGGSAATNAMHDAIERGASDSQALTIGLFAGAAETLMEQASIDSLFNLKSPEKAKDVILNILKQAGAEGTEEGLTTIANTLADAFVMGDKSELESSKRAYMEQGYDESRAEGMALRDWAASLGMDVAGGALSGGFFATGHSALNGGMDAIGTSVADQLAKAERKKITVDDVMPEINGDGLPRAQSALAMTEENGSTAPRNDSAVGGEEAVARAVEMMANENAPAQETRNSDISAEHGRVGEVGTEQGNAQSGPITVDDVMPKVGDMGAKTSDFPHEVKESKGKTLPDYYERNNIPEEGRADNHYTAVTEAESLHNAKLRLEQDYNGEVEELSNKADWNNEDMDMSYMVLDDLRAEAEKTGDWDSFKQWAKLDQDRGGDVARALQSRAKRNRNSATGILAAAADILDTAGDQVGADAVLGHISALANRYDFANQTGDVDALVQVIRDTASERNTGFKQTKKGQKQSKYLNWALDRIAGYAKSGALTGNSDADVDITAANITDADTAYRFLQDFAYTGMLNVAADQNKASVGSKIMAIRRLALLSKTSTVMRNLVANGAFDVVDTLARDISVPLDMLFSKITGTRSVSADAGILSKAKRRGMLDGLAMASLEISLDVNGRNIKGKYVPNGTRTFKMSGNIVDRFFSTLEAVSGYALNVTDEMSKGGTAAEVQRGLDKLYSKGKIKATDDSLRAGGQQEALYRTFQDETVLSNVTKGIRKGLNEAHLGDVGLGDMTMPFAQVPANLVDRSIDYSPAGLAKTGGKLVDALIKAKKGEFTAAKQAQVVQSLGRNITGTGLIALATCCALKGLIRVVNPGGDDENKDKSAFEKMQGQSGTQWNLSATLRAMRGESADWQDDDVLMSIAFLEPFNANMTIGALLAEDLQLEDSVTAKTIMKDSFSGSLASLLDMPMFDTFGDIVDAYTYSDKTRTGDKVLDAGKTLVANEIASLIPNAVKGIAQGMDEYQRDLYTKDDTWGQLGDQFRAVFDRNSLPIKQDSFGNDMTNDGKVLNALNNNILPGWISTYDTDDLMNEISRVARESGSDSVYPTRKAPDKLTIDSVDYPLDQKQQTQYQKTYGQAERDSRSALMENDTYGNFTVDQQAIAHGYAEAFSKQVASNAINSNYELSDWVQDVKDKSPEEIADAVIRGTVESLAKKQGTDKYDGLGDMLKSGQIEDKVAIACLPPSTFEKWESYGEQYKVPVSTLMDVISYGNSDDAKGEKNSKGKYIEGKTHQDKMRKYLNGIKGLSPAQKRGIWKIVVSDKGDCPW